MPLELRPGNVVPIPCRHCGRAMVKFTVAEGNHSLPCPKCSSSTRVQVYLEGGMLRIKTADITMTGKPKSAR